MGVTGDWFPPPQLVFRQGCGEVAETAVASVSAGFLVVFWRAQCLKDVFGLIVWNRGQQFEDIVGQWLLYLIPLFLITS